MEKEKALLEKQLEQALQKRRNLEDVQIGLIELNREKAKILMHFSDAWQGNQAYTTIAKLQDEMEAEWRETRKNANALEDQLLEEQRQIRNQLERLEENNTNGAY
ncbi:hypothetical protein BMT55_07185 [Listeria newyorkensis]|uniref:Uncharacterized protein n=1 Tax=Listeria newyorkensis TaxID=1497681 RepID=A0ABX4XNR0_9LIST|nr:hypothetical protein [Listeria newyorkensis]KGL38765.1 hypothetical protein EP58_15130 [Listeria newyorkensis]PNP92736.1 hypothetical protein BMT55_07185 [Listeria newyorkensis]WAO23070.1 hypothetical protein OTR81_07335 [Listeria newyorkensis]SQC57038.1 Uncharacterised protein [Listeria newyorkensis]